MEAQQEIFVFASPEIQELLVNNGTDLVELLNQEGIAVRRGYVQDPTQSGDSGYKDPVTIILATAALVMTLTPTIKAVIEAMSHKVIEVKEKVLVPVEDSHGNIVYDAAGQPKLYWIERTQLKETTKGIPEESISLKAPLAFELTYKSSPK